VLPTLHNNVARALADVQYIAGLLGAPLSEQDRRACLKRAQCASRLLHEITGLSLTPASIGAR
jgi:hypothetical protein